MKSIIIFSIVLLFVITPAYGQLLSDATGLINRLDIQTSGHNFEVILTSNFDLVDYSFDKNNKQLTINLDSGLDDNLGELVIPTTLLNGDLTFYLNDEEFYPNIQSSEKVHFVTLKFSGIGSHVFSVTGTEYLVGLDEIILSQNDSSTSSTESDFLPPNGQFDTTSSDNNLIWLIVGGIVVAIIAVAAIKFVKK